MPVAQNFTASSAIAAARVAYTAMFRRAFSASDSHVQRVAERAFNRGYASLVALQSNATDVAISAHAEDALDAYLTALAAADEDAGLMWLDLFPDLVRDVRRDADVPVQVATTVRNWETIEQVLREFGETSAKGTFQRAANKQPALALAA